MKSKDWDDPYRNNLTKMCDHLLQDEVVERMSKGIPLHPLPKSSDKDRNDFLIFHWRHAAREAQRELQSVVAEAEQRKRKYEESVANLQKALLQQEKRREEDVQGQQAAFQEFSVLRDKLAELEKHMAIQEDRHRKEVSQLQSEIIGRDVNVRLHWEKEEKLRAEKSEKEEECKRHEQTITDLQQAVAELSNSNNACKEQLTYMQRIQDELAENLQRDQVNITTLIQYCDLINQSEAANNSNNSGSNAKWFENQQLRVLYDKVYWTVNSNSNQVAQKTETNMKLEFDTMKSQIAKSVNKKVWIEKRTELMMQAQLELKLEKQNQSREGESANKKNVSIPSASRAGSRPPPKK
jgi:hypothetical protein